jgi:flavodoxin
MNVLVMYQSRSGHTREAAEGIGSAVERLNHTVSVKSVIEVSQTDVENADVLFVGTWVHGLIFFGVRPAEAELWVPALPSLEGKPVGVFCTYRFNPRGSLRKLGTMLEGRGATILGQKAFHRSRTHDGVENFVQRVLAATQGTSV